MKCYKGQRFAHSDQENGFVILEDFKEPTELIRMKWDKSHHGAITPEQIESWGYYPISFNEYVKLVS